MICPVCRANNDQGPACRRCKADLSILFELEGHRAAYLARARTRIEDDAATAEAQAADDLRHGRDARRVLAVAALLRRDFGRAWLAYLRVRQVK
jgi:hypothetical protein